MEKFVVWDEDSEMFIDEKKCILVNGTLFRNEKDFANEISDDLSMFFSIGLKDINKKSIYADSSIVEFRWINGFGNIQTDWGVFKYDIDYLQYLIYEENEDINKSSIKDILNIKIIDTIQENKLGLI